VNAEALAHHALVDVRIFDGEMFVPTCACGLVWLGGYENEFAARLAWAGHVMALFGVQDVADLEETVARADRAMDVALRAFGLLAKNGNIKREVREEAVTVLMEARNEKIPGLLSEPG
jgi:hypothetical protein